MAGVTSNGFQAKRLADVVAESNAQLALIVDPVSGETLAPNLDSTDPAMQVVKVPLDGVANAWEAAQLVFQQFDPGAATGNSLKTLVQLNGLTALDASQSIVNLLLTGSPSTVVPAGQLVSDINNVNQWQTVAAVTLSALGSATVDAKCVTYGPISALANSIINIVTPIPGLINVTNPLPAIQGRNVETTTELRLRRDRSTMAPAASPVESVYANLGNIPGVTYARVRQNNTLVTDTNGIPAKSVAAVVVGGADKDIAYKLLERTGIVANWFGNTGLTLYDIQNEPYNVRWTRPTALTIYIALSIQVTNASVFPANGIQQIKNAIIAYAQGGAPALGITDGFGDVGFPPGSPVLYSRLFTPINYVPGHRVTSLAIGTTASPTGQADIAVPWNQVAEFIDARIIITVVP